MSTQPRTLSDVQPDGFFKAIVPEAVEGGGGQGTGAGHIRTSALRE